MKQTSVSSSGGIIEKAASKERHRLASLMAVDMSQLGNLAGITLVRPLAGAILGLPKASLPSAGLHDFVHPALLP